MPGPERRSRVRAIGPLLSEVRWYLRTIDGRQRYDDYVAAERAAGHTPLDRRAFERARVDARGGTVSGRCC